MLRLTRLAGPNLTVTAAWQHTAKFSRPSARYLAAASARCGAWSVYCSASTEERPLSLKQLQQPPEPLPMDDLQPRAKDVLDYWCACFECEDTVLRHCAACSSCKRGTPLTLQTMCQVW